MGGIYHSDISETLKSAPDINHSVAVLRLHTSGCLVKQEMFFAKCQPSEKLKPKKNNLSLIGESDSCTSALTIDADCFTAAVSKSRHLHFYFSSIKD